MRRSRTRSLGVIVLGLSATACSGAPLPEDVNVRVYQTRSDVVVHKIEIQVANGSDEDLTIRRATLESDAFESGTTWERMLVIPAGLTTDLKVALPPLQCPAVVQPERTVTLEYEIAGQPGSVTVTPADTLDTVARVSREGCLADGVAEIVTITADPVLTLPGSRLEPASVTFTAEPTGAPGSVHIVGVRNTTLLTMVDDEGSPVNERPIGISVGEPGPARFSVPFVPIRCDPHALAEDKRGTVFPLVVDMVSDGGVIDSPVPVELQAQVYGYVNRYCGT